MKHLLVIFLLTNLFEMHDQYRILFEKLELGPIDKNSLNVQGFLYNVNDTVKAPNATITLKIDLPEATKITFSTYRLINNKYTVEVFHLEKRLKDALEMETFDVPKLCNKYSRPPIVWPILKNVPYRTIGWLPDTSKYPMNVPSGKWKVVQEVKLPSKGTIATANWIVSIEY